MTSDYLMRYRKQYSIMNITAQSNDESLVFSKRRTIGIAAPATGQGRLPSIVYQTLFYSSLRYTQIAGTCQDDEPAYQ